MGIAHSGNRPSNLIAKKFKAAFQSCIGLVHFLDALFRARYNILKLDLSLGNAPFAFITLRMDRLIDSIVIIVYITLRISTG